MSDLKLCVDCKWYVIKSFWHGCSVYAKTEPVTGNRLIGVVPCGRMRGEDSPCKYRGILWEAK